MFDPIKVIISENKKMGDILRKMSKYVDEKSWKTGINSQYLEEKKDFHDIIHG